MTSVRQAGAEGVPFTYRLLPLQDGPEYQHPVPQQHRPRHMSLTSPSPEELAAVQELQHALQEPVFQVGDVGLLVRLGLGLAVRLGGGVTARLQRGVRPDVHPSNSDGGVGLDACIADRYARSATKLGQRCRKYL